MKKGLGCFTILLAVALVISVLINFLSIASWFGIDESAMSFVQPKAHFSEHLIEDGKKDVKDKIVRIDLEGVIASGPESSVLGGAGMDVEGVKRALEQAVDDKNVKAIVLLVNSPGGEVTASDTLYHAVKEAAKKKNVVVYMDSMAASGGYYLSCGASRIIANETTLTGSIGVIIHTLNYSQAFGKLGLDSVTFKSGDFKDTLSGSRPMRDDEKVYVQTLVTDMYEKFLGVVSEARKIPKEQLKAGIADGRVFTGGEALKNKLVDQLGYIEDAYAEAKKLGGAPGAMVVKYQHHTSLLEIFGALGSAQKTGAAQVRVDLTSGVLPHLKPGTMYMLPPSMVP